MNLLEMLKLEFEVIGRILQPFAIVFIVAVLVQFIVYRVFKFSIFNELVKVALKEINK